MRMVPPVMLEPFQSAAEAHVFRLLEATDLGKHATAYHSVNLPRHAYKLVAEIDFAVITPEIVLVLEVKGGGIHCHDGMWTYTDRYGVGHHNSEGPFQQARSAMFALRDILRNRAQI